MIQFSINIGSKKMIQIIWNKNNFNVQFVIKKIQQELTGKTIKLIVQQIKNKWDQLVRKLNLWRLKRRFKIKNQNKINKINQIITKESRKWKKKKHGKQHKIILMIYGMLQKKIDS